MRSARRMLAAGLLCLVLGCNIVSPIAYYLGPRRIQKAEFAFPEGPVAILVDAGQSQDRNPVFEQAFHERMAEIFVERKAKAGIVPYSDILTLRRDRPGFDRWSLQQVGRELDAMHVLSVRVDRLSLLQSPGYPVMEPTVTLRTKIIATDHPPEDARVWPAEREGRSFTIRRPAEEATGPDAMDAATRKLGRQAANEASVPFFDIDLEENKPRED